MLPLGVTTVDLYNALGYTFGGKVINLTAYFCPPCLGIKLFLLCVLNKWHARQIETN